MTSRPLAMLMVFGVLCAALAVFRLFVGPTIGWPAEEILDLRLTRLAAAFAVGAGLGMSGAMLQALLRNPLASPFVLGMASGAGFGVILAVYIGHVLGMDALRYAPNWIPALLGAAASLSIVMLLGRRGGQVDPVGLILVGVVASAVFGALSLLVQHLLPVNEMARLTYWMMGRISDDVGWGLIGWCSGVVVFGGAIGAWLGRAMDAASMNEEEAISVGVPLTMLRPTLMLLAGAMTACAVVLGGPIAFVGLIAPHLVRRIAGPHHRTLIVGSAFVGAAIVIGADALVNAVRMSGGRLPIGVFTALLGGPVFIWVLRSQWGASA
jgi:iron complex transport system permease protein